MTPKRSGVPQTGLYLVVAAALGACTGSGVDVPADSPVGDLVLRAAGSGNWMVDCSATTIRGRTAASDISGRGGESYDVIALRDVISASCSYESGDEPLRLTLEEAGMACPFGDFAEGVCLTTVAADSVGSFNFTPA